MLYYNKKPETKQKPCWNSNTKKYKENWINKKVLNIINIDFYLNYSFIGCFPKPK